MNQDVMHGNLMKSAGLYILWTLKVFFFHKCSMDFGFTQIFVEYFQFEKKNGNKNEIKEL